MNKPIKPAQSTAKRTAKSYRGRHRSMSDEAAHDNGKPFTPPPIIEHPLICADEPVLVDTPSKLDDAIEHLRATGTFGYDTEFIGEDSYYPHLCVIQAATTERVILIDPLTIEDLSPWWAMLTDASLCKILHAGAQDIEPVSRLTGKPAAKLFDTQVVAGLVGLDYPLSLGNTIQAILGVEHDAGAKFSKWDRRPLTPQQIHYAAGDVRYLCAVHAWMQEKLDALGNAEFAEQACIELCDPERYAFDPLARKVKAKGVHKLSRKKRAVFNGLLIFREELACRLNITPRGLLADEAVYEIADALPKDQAQIGSIKFVPRPVAEQHGQAIVQAVEIAIAGPHPVKPTPPRHSRDALRDAVNKLWDRIAAHCEARSITPSAITSKRELGPLLSAALDGKPPPQLAVNTGWRKQLLGGIISDSQLLSS
ncbi:MAG: HRDC domain-containing protein [Phycisphaeraceae bacterium]|nr:HRDC domain-containing protein [Phycisphaeraceae bacterium]